MAAAPAPAAPRFLSKSINWGAGGIGVAGKEGAYNALLVSRRKSGEVVIEDLGTHSQPWFAAVCHDVLFLKTAYDAGNTFLDGLEHVHLVARPGGEAQLNFPLSSFTCQPPFWDAMDSYSYGQLVVQLRCRRDLARVLFFGDTWDPALPKRRRQQQQQKRVQQNEQQKQEQRKEQQQQQQEQQRPQQQAEMPAPRGASALPPRQGAQEQARLERPSTAGAGAVQSQPPGPRQAPSSDGISGTLPSAAAAAAAAVEARPAVKKVQPEWSSGSEDSAPLPAPAASPAVLAGAGAAALPHTVRTARSRSVVLSDSDNDTQAPGAHAQEGFSAAAAGGAGPGARPRGADDSSDEGEPAAAPPTKRQKTLSAAATPEQGTEAAAAASAAAPGGQRPAEEPWNVWIKDNPEFPPGSGKFPFYLKKGPMGKNYYTISVAAGDALLDHGHDTKYEGDLTLQDASSGRTWEVHTSLKREASKGQQRYITRTSQFNRDNNLQPHDVLWLQRGPRRDCLLFGVWRWGSQEAADFAAKLGGARRGGGKKVTALPPSAQTPPSAAKKGIKEPSEDD
ncbi:hypothetical protein ABPG77_004196 [Micractinium sp. CCAP 211/92]